MVTGRDKVLRLGRRLCGHEASGPGRGRGRQTRRGAGPFLISRVTGSPFGILSKMGTWEAPDRGSCRNEI